LLACSLAFCFPSLVDSSLPGWGEGRSWVVEGRRSGLWLVGRLVGWLVGCLIEHLVGWLVGLGPVGLVGMCVSDGLPTQQLQPWPKLPKPTGGQSFPERFLRKERDNRIDDTLAVKFMQRL